MTSANLRGKIWRGDGGDRHSSILYISELLSVETLKEIVWVHFTRIYCISSKQKKIVPAYSVLGNKLYECTNYSFFFKLNCIMAL